MKQIFIDTNVFVRFLVADNKRMAKECRELFQKIEAGEIKAETDLIVITEVIWVLTSFYKIEKAEVVKYVALLLEVKNLLIKDENIINKALEIFQEKNVDFIDAFCASFVLKRKISYLCSYDKDYDKIFKDNKTIKRIEPKDL